MSRTIKDRQTLDNQVKSFIGNQRAAWKDATNLAIDLFNYFLHSDKGKHDLSLLGKLYNDIKDEHRPIANALRKAAIECCGVAFRADPKNEGRIIVAKGKVWETDPKLKGATPGTTIASFDQAMIKLAADMEDESRTKKGLKLWKPDPKNGTKNSPNHSKVYGVFQSADKLLAAIEDDPQLKAKADEFRQRAIALFEEMGALAKDVGLQGYGTLYSSLQQAQSKYHLKVAKELREQTKDVA